RGSDASSGWTRAVVIQRIIEGGGIMHDIWLEQLLSVDEHLLVDKLQMIPPQAGASFLVMLIFSIRVFQNNDVAAFQLTIGQHFFIPSPGPAENKLVHQQVVADEQRAFHRG